MGGAHFAEVELKIRFETIKLATGTLKHFSNDCNRKKIVASAWNLFPRRITKFYENENLNE